MLYDWLHRYSPVFLADAPLRPNSLSGIAGLRGGGVRILRVNRESSAGVIDSLHQARIDVTDLIRHGSVLGDRSTKGQVRILFALWHTYEKEEDKELVEECSIGLQALRAKVFQAERTLRFTPSDNTTLPLVEIIIDGCGSPIANIEEGTMEVRKLPWLD